MKLYLTRRYLFSALHRLHNPALTAQANRDAYGKCNHPHGHGHNYFLEVTVSGPIAPDTGMICDLTILDAVVSREILARFDHQNLNQLQEFAVIIPTTENLAIQIQQILSRAALPAHLEGIRIEETSNNSFEYAGHQLPKSLSQMKPLSGMNTATPDATRQAGRER